MFCYRVTLFPAAVAYQVGIVALPPPKPQVNQQFSNFSTCNDTHRHKSHLTLKSISPFVRSLLEKFEQFPPLRSRPAPFTGHQPHPHRAYTWSPDHDSIYLSAVNPDNHSPQHSCAPTPQKYDLLPPNLPTPQKYDLPPNLATPQTYALPPNPPLLQDLPKMAVQEMEFKEAAHDIQKKANQNFELLATASRHNETDVVSDEDESQNILERVWAKLFEAAQNAQEEHFDFKN
jgi:hypothetical protein